MCDVCVCVCTRVHACVRLKCCVWPPQSEFVPARRMCGSECACQENYVVFLFKIDIMLAKRKVISFNLLKMIKLAPQVAPHPKMSTL